MSDKKFFLNRFSQLGKKMPNQDSNLHQQDCLLYHLTTRPAGALLTREVFDLFNGDERKAHFNIQIDEISQMLQEFLMKICILEAVAFLDL